MIADPAEYFHQLGSLHDAALVEVCWNARSAVLRLEFDDYRASISEGDTYPRFNATVEFVDVAGFTGATNGARFLVGDIDTVSDLDVVREGEVWRAVLQMNSGAVLCWDFAALRVDERQS